MAFEGEYLNGKRWNGKGKEFDYKGNFVFEGEYLNGKYNKGKELNILIHPIKMEGYIENFEGDYLNGKKWNGKNQLILINTCIRCNAKDSIIKENQYGELVCINCGLVIGLPNQAPNLLGMEFPIENLILNLAEYFQRLLCGLCFWVPACGHGAWVGLFLLCFREACRACPNNREQGCLCFRDKRYRSKIFLDYFVLNSDF